MEKLHTIQEVHKMFNTMGSSPLLVTCDDLHDWVCKYDAAPLKLFNELIASEFAKIWTIKTPKTALITVREEHIPYLKFTTLQPNYFTKECFGSQYIEHAKEIDNTVLAMFKRKSNVKRIKQKNVFLKIALFDIWLANEDRNHNNFNLLLHNSADDFYFFYAIDYVNIFTLKCS